MCGFEHPSAPFNAILLIGKKIAKLKKLEEKN